MLFGSTPATFVNIVDDGLSRPSCPPERAVSTFRVMASVSDPGDHANFKSPFFGYGESAVATRDRFTYAATREGLQLTGLTSPLTAGASATFTVQRCVMARRQLLFGHSPFQQHGRQGPAPPTILSPQPTTAQYIYRQFAHGR